jgi:putative membrane protein
MRFITRILITALALILVTKVVPGIEVAGVYPALVAALFLGIMNAIVRPILVILTLPVTILTLGIFIFVINAILFLFVASFVDGFTVESFGSALIGSILVSIISSLLNKFVV